VVGGILVGLMKLGGALAKTQTFCDRLVTV
jgi:hypothetical protein